MSSIIDAFLTMPAVLVNRTQTGTPDRLGTPAWVESEPETIDFWWHPVDTEEQITRPAGIVIARGYARPDVAISTTAKIAVSGVTFEIASPPRVYHHPTDGAQYQTVELVQGPDPEGGS